MEIFLDTADLEAIERFKDFIDGVTTNPSIIAKFCKSNMKERIKQICMMVDGPVSAEVISTETSEMLKEGEELAKIHPNVCVKLPCTFNGLTVCKRLTDEGIPTNMTLCFSPIQALLAAQCGATYVSPFVGRVDDLGHDGSGLVEEIVDMYNAQGYETKVLAASVRTVDHFIKVAEGGADAATLPVKVLEQSFSHPMTSVGLEQFAKDWNQSK